MNFVVAIAIALAVFRPFGIQAALSIVSYDIECPLADPEYFRDIDIYILDEGRDNEFFVNFTIIKSVPKTIRNSFKIIGATMGEFKVATGIDFTVPSCEGSSEPIFGARIMKSLGITTCPSPPGVYGNSHLNLVDESTLPDSFPPNHYMIVLDGKVGNKIIWLCKVYWKAQ